MKKPIPNFSNYKLSSSGEIFNSKGNKIKQRTFKNTNFVRLYKNGKRYTVSVNKLLFKEFDLIDKLLPLDVGEVGIRYDNTHYFLTNKGRCINIKTGSFLKPIFRNNYPTFNIYIESGRMKVVYALSYLNKYFKSEV